MISIWKTFFGGNWDNERGKQWCNGWLPSSYGYLALVRKCFDCCHKITRYQKFIFHAFSNARDNKPFQGNTMINALTKSHKVEMFLIALCLRLTRTNARAKLTQWRRWLNLLVIGTCAKLISVQWNQLKLLITYRLPSNPVIRSHRQPIGIDLII